MFSSSSFLSEGIINNFLENIIFKLLLDILFDFCENWLISSSDYVD